MSSSSRAPAVIAYLIPIVGWVYVLVFQRKNAFAVYHARQAIGLGLILIATFIGWVVVAWVLAWIPYMSVFSVALFGLVIGIYFFGFIAWIIGLINALTNRSTPLPGFGKWANRLPIQAE